ncbi:MAG: hypothetical protein HY720_25845 [Planctomycetes bacterium]|nr:hypothetical protein [Planctomycetota bacterium]
MEATSHYKRAFLRTWIAPRRVFIFKHPAWLLGYASRRSLLLNSRLLARPQAQALAPFVARHELEHVWQVQMKYRGALPRWYDCRTLRDEIDANAAAGEWIETNLPSSLRRRRACPRLILSSFEAWLGPVLTPLLFLTGTVLVLLVVAELCEALNAIVKARS